MSIYVGLDISLTSTGFGKKSNDDLDLATVKTKPKDFENDLVRYQHIRDELMRRIPDDVDMICIEDFYVPRQSHQIKACIGLIQVGTIVRLSLLERGLPFRIVTTTQLKKYCTGKGQCPKDTIVKEVYKRWNVDTNDNNQADACVLAYMAESIMESQDLPKFKSETIQKILADGARYNV